MGFGDMAGHKRQRSDGEDVGEFGGDRLEDSVFEFVEGVEDNGRGIEAVLGFRAHEIEHCLVGVLGSDEAWEVF